MIFIDRQFLKKQNSNVQIHQMIFSIPVQELEFIVHQFNQYIKMNIYLSEKNCTAVIRQEAHIVDDF